MSNLNSGLDGQLGMRGKPKKVEKFTSLCSIVVKGTLGNIQVDVSTLEVTEDTKDYVTVSYEVGGGIMASKTLKKRELKKATLAALGDHPYTLGAMTYCSKKDEQITRDKVLNLVRDEFERFEATGKKLSMDFGLASLYMKAESMR